MLEKLMECLFLSLFALGVVVTFVVLFLAYKDFSSPTFELRKSEWTCIEHKKETRFQLVGKVLVPVDDYVCQNYQLNK